MMRLKRLAASNSRVFSYVLDEETERVYELLPDPLALALRISSNTLIPFAKPVVLRLVRTSVGASTLRG